MQTLMFDCEIDASRDLVLRLPTTVTPGHHRISLVIDPPEPIATTEARQSQPQTGDALVDHYQPRTELGRKLMELRRAYIEGGGKLMTQDEILAEVRRCRGEDDHD